jgi:type IV pilus assembly protein PilE
LIELIVVLLIISLLLKFTFANFSGYVQNSYRVSAQADLLAFAGAMEQHYLSRLSYFGAAISGDIGPASIFPHHSPANEPAENRHYDLHIDYIDREGETFILRASPIDGLSGNLFYYGDGRKAWDQNNDGQIAPEEFCWQC